MSASDDVRLIPTTVHGRILVRDARAAAAAGLLVGFHGYMESAATQMERLAAIPGAARWTLVSIQALNRFYAGRSRQVVAGWMTREDREEAIADNINYVDAALDAVHHDERTRIVYAGFSQGVAMAFRSGVLGRRRGTGIIAVGGDVPPELLADHSTVFPPVLLAAGAGDEWFTPEKMRADVAALSARGIPHTVFTHDGGHEWRVSGPKALTHNDEALTHGVGDAAGAFLASLLR